MSNPFEGQKMPELDETDLAQIAARKKASEEAKKKLDEILAKHQRVPSVKITRTMRRETKKIQDDDQKLRPF